MIHQALHPLPIKHHSASFLLRYPPCFRSSRITSPSKDAPFLQNDCIDRRDSRDWSKTHRVLVYTWWLARGEHIQGNESKIPSESSVRRNIRRLLLIQHRRRGNIALFDLKGRRYRCNKDSKTLYYVFYKWASLCFTALILKKVQSRKSLNSISHTGRRGQLSHK